VAWFKDYHITPQANARTDTWEITVDLPNSANQKKKTMLFQLKDATQYIDLSNLLYALFDEIEKKEEIA